MKAKLDPGSLEKSFKALVKEEMTSTYMILVHQHNDLVDAFNELSTIVTNHQLMQNSVADGIQSINSVFRRLNIPDRIKDQYQIGTVVSNVLWKVINVHQTRTLPEMHGTKQGQIPGQSWDI
jgi:hypothetical protein